MTEHSQSFTSHGQAQSPGSLPGVAPVQVRDRAAALAGRRWFPDSLGAAGVLIVTALLAWHRLWLENGLAYLDVATFYMPWYAHLGESIRALDIPGWNPYQFSGTPFAGDPQSGWWYFPAMGIFAALEPVPAYQTFIIFHLAFAGLSAYFLCRILGLRVIPSLIAGVAYQSGPLVSHVSCCLIHVQLGAWIPAAMIGVELSVRGKHLTQRSVGWVVTGFTMSQMMAGWPGQGMYNGCLLTGGYLAFRIVLTRENGILGLRDRVVRLIGDSAGVLSFALLWAAAGLLPRVDIVSRTNVAWGEYDGFQADKYSSGWRVYTVLDQLFTDNNGYRSLLFYLGAPVIVLAIIGVALAWRRPWVPFLALATVLTSIMTLKPTIIHQIVFLLPKYEDLHSHVPSRVLAVQWIGPTILAATAIDALMQSPSRRKILEATLLGFTSWGVVITLLVLGNRPVRAVTVAAAVLTAALVCLFSIVNTPPRDRLSRFVPRAQASLAILIMLLVIADPAGGRLIRTLRSGQTMSEVIQIPTGEVPRSAIDENASSTDSEGAGEFLQRQQAEGEYFRYFGYDNVLQQAGEGLPTTYREYFYNPIAISILVNARAMRLHLFDVQGYNPVQLSNYVAWLNEMNGVEQNYHDAQVLPGGLTSNLLDLLNARYIIIPNDAISARPREDLMILVASYPEVYRNNEVRVLENPNAMPRVWITHNVIHADPALTTKLLNSDSFDPLQTVILDQDAPEATVGQPNSPASESIEIVEYEADRIELRVHADANGFVVLSETYERGWHAKVDGKSVSVEEAYGLLRALPVSAGDHEIVMTYDPWSLRIGFYVSLFGAAVSFAVIGAFVTRRPGFSILEEDRS